MTRRERIDPSTPEEMSARMREIVQLRGNLPREDLEYLFERAQKMRDERMRQCIEALIGWGDDERAELETFIAVACEVLKKTNPSKIREAARIVHIRMLM